MEDNLGFTLKASEFYCETLLVRELRNGNVLAFNLLYKRYSVILYKFAYGYLKSKDDSEELVQEVFTIIWYRHENLKEDLSFKSFLFTITFNLIKKHFRTRAYKSNYIKDTIKKDIDNHTIQEVNYDSLHHYLHYLSDQLPPKRKEVFLKSRFDGLSVKEIAETMGISYKTVENQLHHALEFIKTRLILEEKIDSIKIT